MEGVTGKLLAMGFVGVPSTFLSVFCLANPKACFGSCPTFYAWNGKDMKLMAEGFSSSILRSYEKSDIDMLYWSKTRGKDQSVKYVVATCIGLIPNVIAAFMGSSVVLFGIPFAVIGFSKAIIEYPASTLRLPKHNVLSEFNKFARFPQGIPTGVDLTKLSLITNSR